MTTSPEREGQACTCDARPHVVLDLDYGDGLFHLVLANLGGRVAYEVKVEFSRPLSGIQGKISELPLFQRLPLLRAGREIRVFLGTGPLVLAGNRESSFRAVVSYLDRERERYDETFEHDLSIFRDCPEVVRN